MDPADVLFARLALARGWISREVYDETLVRLERLQTRGLPKTAEDVLRESGELHEDRLRVLRRLLGRTTRQARVGDYLLVRQIGSGGTGLVFESRHRRTGRIVALKVLFPRLEKEAGFADRFLREAKVLARIDHGNVVHAYDAGRDGDLYYIVTELVDGRDLRQILTDTGPLSIEGFLDIALALSRGLEAIHLAGLVHRDVKPANVLVARDRSRNDVKLVDLGLFHGPREEAGIEAPLSRDGMVIGTPEYMSPERILGKLPIDHRSDLYSLGATFFHMLTGRVPFVGDSPQEIVRGHLDELPAPLGEFREDVFPSLDFLIQSLLAKDPAQRPESAAQVVRLLEKYRLVTTKGVARGRFPSWARLSWAIGVTFVFLMGLGIGLLQRGDRHSVSEDPAERSVPKVVSTVTSDEEAVSKLPALSLGGDSEARRRLSIGLEEVARRVRGVSRALEIVGRRWVGSVAGMSQVSQSRTSGIVPVLAGDIPVSDSQVDRKVSVELSDWMLESARLVRADFREALVKVPEDRAILALLLTRETVQPTLVWVESTAVGLTFVDLETKRSFGLEEVDPLMVLAWGGFAYLDDESLMRAVGYLFASQQFKAAALCVRELEIEVSSHLRDLLVDRVESAASPLSGARLAYLDSVLEISSLRRRGERALREGRWQEARGVYQALLSRNEIPDFVVGKLRQWEVFLARAKILRWLTAGVFHGETQALEPLISDSVRVEYSFANDEELLDYRMRPGRWQLRDGSLTPSEPRESVDSVAIFGLPCRMEVRWSLSKRRKGRGPDRALLTLFFDDVGVGVRTADRNLYILREGTVSDEDFYMDEDVHPDGVKSDAGSLWVEWTAEKLLVDRGDGQPMEADHGFVLPGHGRLGFRTGPGVTVEFVALEGEVHVGWARARREFVEKDER